MSWIDAVSKFKTLLATVVLTFGVLSGIASAGYYAYRDYEDLQEQVAANTRSILATRFFELERKRKMLGLTAHEYIEYCSIGRELGYFQSCPQNGPISS